MAYSHNPLSPNSVRAWFNFPDVSSRQVSSFINLKQRQRERERERAKETKREREEEGKLRLRGKQFESSSHKVNFPFLGLLIKKY